ncbi:MAG: ABC transporter substrate-binding protein [Spirochaetota bacterium]
MRYRDATFFLIFCLLFCLSPAPARSSEDSGRFVIDMAGRRVLIPREVRRVITAGGTPAVNAFIFAIGKGATIKNGLPLTMTMHDNRWKYQTVFAPSLVNQPVVSASAASVWTPNLEVLATLPHDLIFVDSESTARMLEKRGFTVISLNWRDTECVRKTIALMGEIFNQRDKAKEFEEYYQNVLLRVSAQVAAISEEKRPRVLYIRINPMALPMASTASHLIMLAGGRYGATGMIPEYSAFSLERLITWDPDILLVGGPAEVKHIYHEKCYSQLKAVKNQKVYVVPVGAHPWTNFTPEQAISILWLAKLLYPDRFEGLNIADEMKYFYHKFFGYQLTDMQISEILTQNIQ